MQEVVSGSWDNTVRRWDAATGAMLHALEWPSSDVYSVAFFGHPAVPDTLGGTLTSTISNSVHTSIVGELLSKSHTIAIFERLRPLLIEDLFLVVAVAPGLQRVLFGPK